MYYEQEDELEVNRAINDLLHSGVAKHVSSSLHNAIQLHVSMKLGMRVESFREYHGGWRRKPERRMITLKRYFKNLL